MGKAILGITPELLIDFLGIGKFNVLRTKYGWERDQIEFIVEPDLLPETNPAEYLPTITPTYERIDELRVRLKEIRLWHNGELVKYEDMEPFKTPEKEPLGLSEDAEPEANTADEVSDIEMFPVTSSNIDRYGYDQERQILRVKFKNGTVYDVHDVPHDVMGEMNAAPSIGSFYNKRIRPCFKAVKLEE